MPPSSTKTNADQLHLPVDEREDGDNLLADLHALIDAGLIVVTPRPDGKLAYAIAPEESDVYRGLDAA